MKMKTFPTKTVYTEEELARIRQRGIPLDEERQLLARVMRLRRPAEGDRQSRTVRTP